MQVLNLLFVARGGTAQLAAAALGNNVAVMLGRLVLLGLCGALDTLAAQAWGAGKESRLPLLLQRCVLFLWAHCGPLSAAMLLLPSGLTAIGGDAGLAVAVRRYLVALLPSMWLEAVSRPITRVLVARGTVTPQMLIAMAGLPLAVGTNYGLVVAAGWQYLGAAAAMSASAGYDVLMLLAYIAFTGQWGCVVGTPTRRALGGWKQFARLAYPAASMKCAESWAFTICTLAAALLPDPCTATAAVGVAYNVYGVAFIAFVACSTAACVTVGNRLGAGDARGAKFAAAASLLIVPLAAGGAAAALLLEPSREAIIDMFVARTPDGGGAGPVPEEDPLRTLLRRMLAIVAGLVALDGVQTLLSGVIQGCGRQRAGALVNFAAFYLVALPLALGLAFRVTLPASWGPALWGGRTVGLGLGPEGLYIGMGAGPLIQTLSYTYILLRTDWQRSAEAASSFAMAASTNSLAGVMRRLDPGALGLSSPQPLLRGGSAGGAGANGSVAAWLLPVIVERSEENSGSGTSSGANSSGPLGHAEVAGSGDALNALDNEAWSVDDAEDCMGGGRDAGRAGRARGSPASPAAAASASMLRMTVTAGAAATQPQDFAARSGGSIADATLPHVSLPPSRPTGLEGCCPLAATLDPDSGGDRTVPALALPVKAAPSLRPFKDGTAPCANGKSEAGSPRGAPPPVPSVLAAQGRSNWWFNFGWGWGRGGGSSVAGGTVAAAAVAEAYGPLQLPGVSEANGATAATAAAAALPVAFICRLHRQLDGNDTSSGGGGGGCGEVYCSCESLAAAPLPGSGDFYVFSASGASEGPDWLEVSTPSRQVGSPSTPASVCNGGGGGSMLSHQAESRIGSVPNRIGRVQPSNGRELPGARVVPVGGEDACVGGCGSEGSEATEYFDAQGTRSSGSFSSLSANTIG
ncbi:hypothetical protein GPECTOR_34g682 [Gonium pectorale]|uniref:Protein DETOXIFICATION n=1 Tax=Gonium pectorale TaxID=33097 RepID=A0A150GCM9_GONPE|nr:hypothetical protein GPECTOR_34g682 [Gonium pectorale]|eukprot:KXZ47523.1 hypothetical protein GPECTOR_34g682 [Gonium pectorale]